MNLYLTKSLQLYKFNVSYFYLSDLVYKKYLLNKVINYQWCNNSIQLQTMPRPFPDINRLIYVPDKTELRNKISLLMSSRIYCVTSSFIYCVRNLPLVFLSSTKQAMCTGRQELWYGSFFKILNIRNITLYICYGKYEKKHLDRDLTFP